MPGGVFAPSSALRLTMRQVSALATPQNKSQAAAFGRPRKAWKRRGQDGRSDRILLYGIHAVEAALANPRRTIGGLLATENAARRLETALKPRASRLEDALPKQLDRLLGSDAVHQGVVLETEPLPPVELEDVAPEGILLVLDQVTDPQNVGAVLRSAAAFGAAGVVLPERHSPPFTGALAKAASGALDIVPVIMIGNLAQSLASAWRSRLPAGRDSPRKEPSRSRPRR